jgi:hypothetical protein
VGFPYSEDAMEDLEGPLAAMLLLLLILMVCL